VNDTVRSRCSEKVIVASACCVVMCGMIAADLHPRVMWLSPGRGAPDRERRGTRLVARIRGRRGACLAATCARCVRGGDRWRRDLIVVGARSTLVRFAMAPFYNLARDAQLHVETEVRERHTKTGSRSVSASRLRASNGYTMRARFRSFSAPPDVT
jgi:hypothetical protein